MCLFKESIQGFESNKHFIFMKHCNSIFEKCEKVILIYIALFFFWGGGRDLTAKSLQSVPCSKYEKEKQTSS